MNHTSEEKFNFATPMPHAYGDSPSRIGWGGSQSLNLVRFPDKPLALRAKELKMNDLYNDIGYFWQACRNILDHKDKPALNYAVNYAKHGLHMTDKHEAYVQALYILGNITHWRGPIANETRSILTNIVKLWK